MNISFQLPYKTEWGQNLYVCGSNELGQWNEAKATKMELVSGDLWQAKVKVKKKENLEYKYFLKDENRGFVAWEFGDPRPLSIDGIEQTEIVVRDYWRSFDHLQNSYYTSPFKKAFFNRSEDKTAKKRKAAKTKSLRLQIRAARVGQDYQVGIVGSIPELGNWDPEKVVLMSGNYPTWSVDIAIKAKQIPFEYKYVIYSNKEKKIVTWEEGANRSFIIAEATEKNMFIHTDEYFQHPVGNWKCAGVAIPVFSLKSEQSAGCGEFADIMPMVDWAVKTGMRIVQVLPVNDTIAIRTWVDSYPYAAISVHALHPMFANMAKIGKLKNKKKQKEFDERAVALNQLEEVEYEKTLELKSEFFKLSFDENKEDFLKSKELKAFLDSNASWIHAYAAFSYLRDKFETPDFTQWGKYEKMSDAELKKLVSPKSKVYDDIAVHYYIQFHLDKQLKEASEYARSKGVVLKGDIPIGIYRNSVDAWRFPHLFNMTCQAGAPPDDFSVSGQNWGFPTYNWEAMSQDGYAWWTERLVKMSEYFDIFRIDHILGFFRIWEIEWDHVEGIMGRFNPALPFTPEELGSRGVHFDWDRMCKPYIRRHVIDHIFGEHADSVVELYLNEYAHHAYEFKEPFSSQRKIKEVFDDKIKNDPEGAEFHNWMRFSLYRLHSEVLFMEAPLSNGSAFNPRIAFHSTFSFQDLDGQTKQNLNELYTHFFYKRHNDFWRDSAMTKLPMVKEATDMLIGGEDLGMVPDCVPGVMEDLQLLSLAIQRMPNDERDFWHPADTPYMSVTSTGSHDMSTLREWWQEDTLLTQNFYNNILGQHGEAPYFCEPWIAHDVINQHMHSPSMLAVFPMQDLLAIDGKLRRERPEEEKINIPAITQHYWKYRMHHTIDQLLKEDDFNNHLKGLVEHGGRLADY